MSDIQLIQQISSLPKDLQKQVADFVEFLKTKSEAESESKEKKNRQFGKFKGLISMSDDFDEPLEDFKEYM